MGQQTYTTGVVHRYIPKHNVVTNTSITMFRNIITSVLSTSSQTYVSREGLNGDETTSTHHDGSWNLDKEAEEMDDLKPELEEVAAKKETAPIV